MANPVTTGVHQTAYLIQDVQLLIQTYVSGAVGGVRDVAETIEAGIMNAPDALKNLGGEYSYAAAADRLQSHMDAAAGVIDSLYDYSTSTQNKEGTLNVPGIEGVTFQNTAYTVANADSVGEAVATIVADCIPCEERILALLSLNPLEDFWDALERIYQMQTGFILDLFDLLLGDKSLLVFADICSLFDFLSFQCVPDLYRMIIVLARLIQKYMFELDDIKAVLNDILGRMFSGTLAPFLGMIDRYQQLIIAPVVCIVDSINAQIQKMDVAQAWQIAVEGEGTPTLGKLNTQAVKESMSKPFLMLRDMIEEANEDLEEQFAKWRKDIRDFLGLQGETDRRLFDITTKIEQVSRMIGLVQALIIMHEQGGIACGPHTKGEQELNAYVTNFLSGPLDITSDGETITMKPKAPEGIDELLNVIGELDKKKERDLPTIEIPVANCLYKVQDRELDKVEDFLGSYKGSQDG